MTSTLKNRLLLGGASAVALLRVVGHFRIPAWQFERQIHEGQTFEEVKRTCGEPVYVLQPGDWLNALRNHRRVQVESETWLYYVFPNSPHRVVVVFEGGRVRRVEHHLN